MAEVKAQNESLRVALEEMQRREKGPMVTAMEALHSPTPSSTSR